MRFFTLVIFVGILVGQQVEHYRPTILFDSTYMHTDSIRGQMVIRRRSLMNNFLERFGSLEFFDYLSLNGEYGEPPENYQQGLINRLGLEEYWRKIAHETAVALYTCTLEDTFGFLLRDVGTLDKEALMAVDSFLQFGKPLSAEVDGKIRMLMNHRGEDVMNFLGNVESRILSGGLVSKAEIATYRAMLRHDFYREVGAQVSTVFSPKENKTCYLLCVFHNHNAGQPASPYDYEASKSVLMGVAIFHENNTVTYEFLSDGKKVGVFGPLESQKVQEQYRSGPKYHQLGQVKLVDRGYRFNKDGEGVRWLLEINARPEVLAILTFDRDSKYLSMIHKESFESDQSVVRLNQFPTIPNGSLEIHLSLDVDHMLVVLANGASKRYIPAFVTQ